MKNAIEYSNKYIGIVDKPMRQAINQFAHKNWTKAFKLFHTNNDSNEANILASFCLLYCAAQLEDDDAEEFAHSLLDSTNFEFWAYLPEHNFPRYARRFAYHFLAYLAKNNTNYTEALNYIEEAISINSPIDDLDDIPLLELKADIYIATNKPLLAFFTIQKILNRDSANSSFVEITKSEAYLNYLENYDLEKLKKGEEMETAMQTLNRYEKFLSLEFNTIEEQNCYFFGKVTEEAIVEAETRLQFNFPPSYRMFILKNGLFRLGKNNDYESRLLSPEDMKTLDEFLDEEWSETKKSLSENELRAAKNLIPFSYGDEGLQLVWFYCFDKRSTNTKTGEMSVYHFCQDNWNFGALPMCKSNGFDLHIRMLIDEKIEWLLND